MESLQSKMKRLETEISELPVGYISQKTIKGKVRQYLQWTEEGKKKSKYLDDETAAIVAEQIARRRKLQQELKTVKALLPKSTRPGKLTLQAGKIFTIPQVTYQTNVLTGDTLKQFSLRCARMKSRPCLGKILDYLRAETDSRVLILYGLRRTGKTTLIQQAIAAMTPEQFEKTAFMQVRPGDTLASVNQDMKQLESQGFRYVFLDEVTLMVDFIEGAALFSDIYAACGMKIVLSGTDSLGFLFSADEQLYDRCQMLHTTFIPYREFESILEIIGIDEYIRYGGTMSLGGIHYNEKSTFANSESTDEYIDSAIARNIQHSLKYYQDAGHFRHLQSLYDRDELTSAINRVVEDINHRFTIDVLTKDFVSHDLGLSARNLRRDREQPTDILDHIDREAFTEGLRQALEIRNRNEQKIEIKDAHRIEIKEYLDLLDLTVDIPIESLPVVNEKEHTTVMSQTGLRYSQANQLVKQLLMDASFQHISAAERKRIIDRVLDEIKGRMMEEVVLLETKKAYPKKKVFKLKFAVGEFDMVIWDPEEITCEIFEIKHSTETSPQQYRHLIDTKKCHDTEFRFGTITGKNVIYRGESKNIGEIRYINVEEYLKGL